MCVVKMYDLHYGQFHIYMFFFHFPLSHSSTISLELLRNLKKAEEKVKTAEEDIEENKNKITELQAQLETLENEATTVLKAYKDAQVGPNYS